MELLALDKDFTAVKYLKYFNLQWDRKYYECGTFSVQILSSEYSPAMAYIYTSNRNETGIIQKIELAETSEGNFIQLSGFFLEYILNDKIIYPTYNGKGNLEDSIRDCLVKYKGDTPLLTLGDVSSYTDTATWQRTGDELGKAFYEVLKTKEMSYKCNLNYEDNKIYFEVFKGFDRTQSQTENSFVIFSKGFRNLYNTKFDKDFSNFKNYAKVAGAGEGSARVVVDVDLSEGKYKKEIFIDARDLEYDSSTQNLADYKNALYQRGIEKLLDYNDIENITFDLLTDNFKYMVDFDIGDKIELIIDTINLSYEIRIIEINEVIKNNTHTISLELGEKKLTEYKKARLK